MEVQSTDPTSCKALVGRLIYIFFSFSNVGYYLCAAVCLVQDTLVKKVFYSQLITHMCPIKLLSLSYRGKNSNRQRTTLTSVLQSKKTVNRKLVIHKLSYKRHFDRVFTTHTGMICLCSSQLQTKDGETFFWDIFQSASCIFPLSGCR